MRREAFFNVSSTTLPSYQQGWRFGSGAQLVPVYDLVQVLV